MNNEQLREEAINGNDDALFDYLAKNNKFEYNMDKAIEEALEFAEVMVKLKTKNKGNPKRPPKIEALKEFGDFILRGGIALGMLFEEEVEQDPEFITKTVEGQVDSKIKKLRDHLAKGNYEGGL